MLPATPESVKATGSTHERILRVSKSLFANRGYEHTSTSAIARQAGTSESQLMKHLGSKAGLLVGIFIEGWTQITEEALAAAQNVASTPGKLQGLSWVGLQHSGHDSAH